MDTTLVGRGDSVRGGFVGITADKTGESVVGRGDGSGSLCPPRRTTGTTIIAKMINTAMSTNEMRQNQIPAGVSGTRTDVIIDESGRDFDLVIEADSSSCLPRFVVLLDESKRDFPFNSSFGLGSSRIAGPTVFFALIPGGGSTNARASGRTIPAATSSASTVVGGLPLLIIFDIVAVLG